MTKQTHFDDIDSKTENTGDAQATVKNVKFTVENISEATAACLFTMVQGNILLLGLSHWLVASQTGILAGILATLALRFAQTSKPWVVSLMLGSITAVVDFLCTRACSVAWLRRP